MRCFLEDCLAPVVEPHPMEHLGLLFIIHLVEEISDLNKPKARTDNMDYD